MALPTYTPVGWENGSAGGTALNKTNMRHMDNAIEANREAIGAFDGALAGIEAQLRNGDFVGDVTAYAESENPISLSACFTSVSSGKTLIAATLTDKGIPTAATDSFAVMANHINMIGSTDTVQYFDIGLSFVPDEIVYPT